MKKNIKYLFIFSILFAVTASVSAYSPLKYTVDPHDSLLFDGDYVPGFQQTIFYGEKNCFVKVGGLKGIVIGEVVKKEIVAACGGNETLYTSKITELKVGDILREDSDILTSVNSWVGLKIFLSTDETFQNTFSSMNIIVGESSEIKVPRIQDLCQRLEEHPPIPIIKGIVTYENENKDDNELTPLPKLTTKGKRSTGKHKKTRYSHEVKITESDTVDVIRVYKGAVEVSMLKIETDEEDMTKKMEKLSEDVLAGKVTAEEMQAKMTEFQNYGQMINELIQPLNVDEGFKCTVTQKSRTVEPLGPDDADVK
jgi:hypothetical protein